MESLMVNLLGLTLIALVIGWFFIAKPKVRTITEEFVDIIVENGVYQPAILRVKLNQPIQLRFLRKDETPCSEYVIFDAFNVNAKLPHNQFYTISITPTQVGEYEFTCQMGMYRGTLIVEDT